MLLKRQVDNKIFVKGKKHILQKLEEENANLKEKVTVLKDKLTEATQLIDNLTEQILSINSECVKLKGK